MKKIKLAVIAVLLIASNMSFGQLSTRENISGSVLITGTRPQAGDYGLYVGPSIFSAIDLIKTNQNYDELSYLGIPLINFKYYKSNRAEWRLGVQLYNKKTKLSGDVSSSSSGPVLEKESETAFRLTPAFAYHFSEKNILDVYAGGGLVLGMNSMSNKLEMDSDDYSYVSQNSLVGGLNLFIGLQRFVADLPLSIGIEYGISALAYYGLKYKHEINTAGNTQVYYTENTDGSGTQYDSLKNNESLIGTDFRLTLSYYFN